jgi:DNA polymerase-4
MSGRKILHVDMDAFFASVEQRDRPELRGRPVVVGGPPNSRGVVAAASYEARAFGIRSAMPSARAGRLCPDAVFVPPDFERYRAASAQIHGVFREVTDLVEPLSIDEAFLDVTRNHLDEPLAREVARYLKARIKQVTGLTASAGAAPNKFIAKLASDFDKPDGLVVVPPERVDAFLLPLKVERIWGVGPATAKRLHELGARTIADIRRLDPAVLEHRFGRMGRHIMALAHGRDERAVQTRRAAKSRGAETTLAKDETDLATLAGLVGRLSERICEGLAKRDMVGRTITLKLRYDDFTTITRSRTLHRPTRDSAVIREVACELMAAHTEAGQRPVRLVGVSLSGFADPTEPRQLELHLPPV